MNKAPFDCRNIAPAYANLHLVRATDLLYEQHAPRQVEWPRGDTPPLLALAALDALSRGHQNERNIHHALGVAGIQVTLEQTTEALYGIPTYYKVQTFAQATSKAIRQGDLGYTRTNLKPSASARRAVRMAVQAWATHPQGPDDLRRSLDDPIEAYRVLGTYFPPAVVRRGYEYGYFLPPTDASSGWYNRRVFTPLIKTPALGERDKEGLHALVNDLTGDETQIGRHNQHRRLQDIYNRLDLRVARNGPLATALSIALHEVDPPDFEYDSVKIPAPRELEAVAFAACGLDMIGIARAMRISQSTVNVLLEKARQKLNTHHTSAAVARLFAMNVFVVGKGMSTSPQADK